MFLQLLDGKNADRRCIRTAGLGNGCRNGGKELCAVGNAAFLSRRSSGSGLHFLLLRAAAACRPSSQHSPMMRIRTTNTVTSPMTTTNQFCIICLLALDGRAVLFDLEQRRTIQQEHSARDFLSSRGSKCADVLCAPQAFRTDGAAKNVRRRPKGNDAVLPCTPGRGFLLRPDS